MLFTNSKGVFSDLEQLNFTDIVFNWIFLESLFFYFFYLSFAKIYTDLPLNSQYYYPKPSEAGSSFFLKKRSIFVFALLALSALFFYHWLNFLVVFFFAFAIISMQKYVEWVRENYTFLNIPQTRKEAILSIKFFFIVNLIVFAVFFYYEVLVLLSLENKALISNLKDLEVLLMKYVHPIKSVSYFFLVFFASFFLRSYFFEAKIKKIDEKFDDLLSRFFNELNDKKLFLVPPAQLLRECLTWFREKMGADYLIMHFPSKLQQGIIVKNPHDEQLLIMPRADDFPYLLREVISDEMQSKTIFYNNLFDLDKKIRKKFNFFLESKHSAIRLLDTFIPATSVISMPIYSFDSKQPTARLAVINVNRTHWREDREMRFFAKFLFHLKVFLNYFDTYKVSYGRQKNLVEQRMRIDYMGEIKRIEEKYQLDEIINKDKVEIQKSVLFEDQYPNNFFLINEKQNELFVFANYFLNEVNRNLNIINNLAILNGLSEEFVKNASSQKNLSVFLRKVNNFFGFFKKEESFISSFVLNYKFESRRLTFSNASHKPLLIYNSQKDEFWLYDINEGLPLGLKKGEEFKDSEVILNKNDVMFLLPDSTLDKNFEGKSYSFDSLHALIRSKLKNPLKLICEAIKNDLQKFFLKNYHNRIVILGIKILS